jgi:protoheme IX farnesyltransferase
MVLFSGTLSPAMLLPLFGILLLACGASAFNQYQEWSTDELMARTKKRPLPSRQISTAEAVRISSILLIGGGFILLYWSPLICFTLGIFNVFWYNGIYTFLKHKTAFAIVPGALTGALPILMGWTAMGGKITDPPVLFLAFFLFLWQMPHFWLMMLKYGDEYHHAGLPVLTDHFSSFQIKVIVMIWMTASGATSLFLVFFRIIRHPSIGHGITIGILGLLSLLFYQLFISRQINYRLIFRAANFFLFLVLVALVADNLLF